MSLASKITLATSIALTTSTIAYVHYRQSADLDKMHAGVIKDVERQRRKKIENIYNLQKQSDLTEQLKKELETKQATETL